MINNFSFGAYNNVVEEIMITQNGYRQLYMSYLYKRVSERFSFLPALCQFENKGDYGQLSFRAERAYCPYVRKYAENAMADVIAIGYKYAYFEKRLHLPLLAKEQRHLLITALVSADYKEDKAYALGKIMGCDKYSLDGVFHFRLKELRERWDGIIHYVPVDMGEVSLSGFLGFLVEDGEGKLFVKGGQVYDEDYRVLQKSALTGRYSTVTEIVLGGAERVYCFGATDEETTSFLKLHYGAKAIFC